MLFVFPLRLSMPSFIQFGPVVSSERVLGSKIGNNIYKYEASCTSLRKKHGLDDRQLHLLAEYVIEGLHNKLNFGVHCVLV